MRLADYIASFLASRGVEKIFMLTGGGAMHLNDALSHEPSFQCIYNHHEQACAMAAEGYARLSNKIGVVNVTTGPGSINALTGVFGAWTDSIPMLIISGQVRRDTVVSLSSTPKLRQLGDQEVDIIPMVKGITKYSEIVTDPSQIRFHLEKSFDLALSGRMGPVWLDIPVDVQGADVDPDKLIGFTPDKKSNAQEVGLEKACQQILQRLNESRRPVIMVGSGIHLSGALPVFERVIEKLGIPVTTAWTAIDALASSSPLYCGRPGSVGDRAGNFAVQNSDALLVIGSRLPIRQTSYNWPCFARAAYKMIVDIDAEELSKPMVVPDLPICADAKEFLITLERQIDLSQDGLRDHSNWLSWCRDRVRRYPVVQAKHLSFNKNLINPYNFISKLFDHLEENEIVACGNATASVVGFQAATIKKGQRVFTNAGCAAMGYDLPAAIGACAASNRKRIICIAGDGSLQLNIQELETVAFNKLPIKLFVLNNNGYLSIRLTQKNFFKRLAGESPGSGIGFPDPIKIAQAYNLPSMIIEGADFADQIKKALELDGPIICDVRLDPDQEFEPKVSARRLDDGTIVSAALEDMAPFLSREELAQNMIIPLYE